MPQALGFGVGLVLALVALVGVQGSQGLLFGGEGEFGVQGEVPAEAVQAYLRRTLEGGERAVFLVQQAESHGPAALAQ